MENTHRSPLLQAGWSYVEKRSLDDFGAIEWNLLKAQRAP